MHNTWFITGTDTAVGKTYVTEILLQTLNQKGYQAVGYKPVASGAIVINSQLRNMDALTLLGASSPTVTLSYEEVNPYLFEPETAPHIISQQEARPIQLSRLTAGAHHLKTKADYLFIEGAGGWYTPLGEKITFADWVKAEQLPIIIVVGLKLGSINHALLTIEAIKLAGLPIVGWIANHLQKPTREGYSKEYLETLHRLIKAPCLGVIPYQALYNECSLNISPLINDRFYKKDL